MVAAGDSGAMLGGLAVPVGARSVIEPNSTSGRVRRPPTERSVDRL